LTFEDIWWNQSAEDTGFNEWKYKNITLILVLTEVAVESQH